MTKKFNINNLQKGQAAGAKYMFVGTSCEQILNPPQLEIRTCEVEGWSEKKCKGKVKYVQIPQNETIAK